MSKKITINPTESVMNLDGKPMTMREQDGTEKELSIGRALALVLISGTKSTDPLRSYVLARKITEAEGPIELDSADASYIKDAFKGFEGFTVLVIGQLMEKLQS